MKRKNYQKSFKSEAIELAKTSDKPHSQIARELGIKESTLYNWLSKSQEPTKQTNAKSQSELEQEVRRLRKELARVTEEREILKKATAFFAKQ